MKTKRIINGVIWAAICIVLCTGVTIEWYSQGCGASSLIAAIAMYTICTAAIGFCIDQTIRDRANN